MRVLWIEDFGGGLAADENTISNLFRSLADEEIFGRWDPDCNLLRHPENLHLWFRDNGSLHSVSLCRHYGDYEDLKSKPQVRPFLIEFDAIAIDINLAEKAPRRVPSGIDFEDSTFHRNAGFWIYNELVNEGFPKERICFLTGEKESTYADFLKHCRAALMPLPTAFEKGDVGFGEFRQWLDTIKLDRYLTLRRGVLDGCQEIVAKISDDPSLVKISRFIPSSSVNGGTDDEALSQDDLSAWAVSHLDQLQQLLPSRMPPPRELASRMRLLARAVTHDWVELLPKQLKSDRDWHRNPNTRLALALAKVLKQARNWLAHQTLEALEPEDVAFLFMANTRAWLDLGSGALHHEQLLLKELFLGQPTSSIDALHQMMKTDYESLGQTASTFDHLANRYNCFESVIASRDWRPPQGAKRLHYLYMLYWYSQTKPGNTAAFSPNVRALFSNPRGSFIDLLSRGLAAKVSCM